MTSKTVFERSAEPRNWKGAAYVAAEHDPGGVRGDEVYSLDRIMPGRKIDRHFVRKRLPGFLPARRTKVRNAADHPTGGTFDAPGQQDDHVKGAPITWFREVLHAFLTYSGVDFHAFFIPGGVP